MKLREVNFETMQPVRKKCITFAKNGNTVVKPYKTLYDLEQITNNPAHKNLYVEVKRLKGTWEEETEYHLFDDLGEICNYQGRFNEDITLENLSERIGKYSYFGKDGLLKQLKEAEDNGRYINKVDIELCFILGEAELAKHYAEYREKKIAEREEERKAEQAEREAREREKEAKHLAEIEKAISDAENKIRARELLYNDEIDDSTVVLRLLKKYSVNVPLKTQGWVNNALAVITYDKDGEITYRYNNSSKDSTVFYKYLKELEEKILAVLNKEVIL